MSHALNDLSSQSYVVVRQLMSMNGMNRKDAINTWFRSKTKEELERRKLFFVSGMRCYWELMLELKNSDMWMRDSFI